MKSQNNPTWKLLLVTGTIILLYMLYFTSIFIANHKNTKFHLHIKIAKVLTWVNVALCSLCMSVLLFQRQHMIFCTIFPGKYPHIFFRYEPTRDLKEYRHLAIIRETTPEHPPVILLIVGESYAKSHSSPYGYEHETNPELKKLKASGNLYVFTQCTAPDIYTSFSFKSIMSTFQSSNPTGKNWYECTTLMDVFQPMYFIYWISNQKKSGAYDSVQAAYAMLCDSIWFSDIELNEMECYDEVVIPVIKSLAETSTKERLPFFIVNLMGQHEKFENRYPPTWRKFTSKDYTDKPENQRKYFAQYDNSTLYNDHVVASIFHLFDRDEVLAFYFPDHGLDIFETDPNFCGYAKGTVPESIAANKRIPFYIYMSDLYKKKHPSQVQMVQATTEKPFCTENFIYTLMDFAGWKFEKNNDVEKFSLFSKLSQESQ